MSSLLSPAFFFFFNDTATTEIYTLSLHDALPICQGAGQGASQGWLDLPDAQGGPLRAFFSKSAQGDRKSTRLNSSHLVISYAVFCLKKKKIKRLVKSLESMLLFNDTDVL